MVTNVSPNGDKYSQLFKTKITVLSCTAGWCYYVPVLRPYIHPGWDSLSVFCCCKWVCDVCLMGEALYNFCNVPSLTRIISLCYSHGTSITIQQCRQRSNDNRHLSHTGEPSVPVQEFNPIPCMLHSHQTSSPGPRFEPVNLEAVIQPVSAHCSQRFNPLSHWDKLDPRSHHNKLLSVMKWHCKLPCLP